MKVKPMAPIVLLSIAGVILYFSLTFFKPSEQPVGLLPLVKEETPVMEPVDGEELYVEGAQIALVDGDNRAVWNLLIENMVEEEEELVIHKIEGEYFTPEGDVFQIRAIKGKLSKDLTLLRLEEEVTLTGEELKLRAKELSWEAGSKELLLGVEVQWEQKNVRVQAKRFKADPALKEITVEGGAHWEFLEER